MTVYDSVNLNRTPRNTPTASYPDLVEEPAFLISGHPCFRHDVRHDVQQDLHPQTWKFQGFAPTFLLWCRDPVSSSPSASPELFRWSYCASLGSFCCACPGQEYSPHPGESDPHAPMSHGLTSQLTGGIPWGEKKRKINIESRLFTKFIGSTSNFRKYGFTELGNIFE